MKRKNGDRGRDSGGDVCARRGINRPITNARAKAPSPLRFAGAGQAACVATNIQQRPVASQHPGISSSASLTT